MNLRRIVVVATVVLAPFAAHPAGTTGLSSYLGKIPTPPRSTQEAYQACKVDDARVVSTGAWVEIESPPVVFTLQKALEDEGLLAASQGAGGAPAMPGMGAPMDAASAAAMQQAMQNMSPQDQLAMAQQMAAQMGAATNPGTLSPADSKMAALLGQRQQGAMSRMQQDLKAQQEWPLALNRWDEAHRALSDEESIKVNSWTGSCRNGSLNPLQKIKREYADQHLALVASQLKEGLAAYERRRVISIDAAGFADQLAPLMRQAQGPMSKQGYSTARSEAVASLTALLAISDEIYRRAAYWHMVRRALTKDDICDGRAG